MKMEAPPPPPGPAYASGGDGRKHSAPPDPLAYHGYYGVGNLDGGGAGAGGGATGGSGAPARLYKSTSLLQTVEAAQQFQRQQEMLSMQQGDPAKNPLDMYNPMSGSPRRYGEGESPGYEDDDRGYSQSTGQATHDVPYAKSPSVEYPYSDDEIGDGIDEEEGDPLLDDSYVDDPMGSTQDDEGPLPYLPQYPPPTVAAVNPVTPQPYRNNTHSESYHNMARYPDYSSEIQSAAVPVMAPITPSTAGNARYQATTPVEYQNGLQSAPASGPNMGESPYRVQDQSPYQQIQSRLPAYAHPNSDVKKYPYQTRHSCSASIPMTGPTRPSLPEERAVTLTDTPFMKSIHTSASYASPNCVAGVVVKSATPESAKDFFSKSSPPPPPREAQSNVVTPVPSARNQDARNENGDPSQNRRNSCDVKRGLHSSPSIYSRTLGNTGAEMQSWRKAESISQISNDSNVRRRNVRQEHSNREGAPSPTEEEGSFIGGRSESTSKVAKPDAPPQQHEGYVRKLVRLVAIPTYVPLVIWRGVQTVLPFFGGRRNTDTLAADNSSSDKV